MSWIAGAGLTTTLAADPAPAEISNGPVVLVVLAALTLVGTLGTAMAPTVLEMVKNRGKLPPSEAKPPVTPVVPEAAEMADSTSVRLMMLKDMLLDYRHQRDNAQARLDDALADLADAQDVIRRQAVQIAELQGGGRRRMNRYDEYYSADPPWGTQQ